MKDVAWDSDRRGVVTIEGRREASWREKERRRYVPGVTVRSDRASEGRRREGEDLTLGLGFGLEGVREREREL